MTQEEKQLLLADLSGRLPYHVRCTVWVKDGTIEEGPLDLQHNYGDVLRDAFYYNKIKDIKPYLRPMSSMTEEENKKLDEIWLKHTINEGADYLNSIHVDYRGLIEKGLAIKVTKENNPYKD